MSQLVPGTAAARLSLTALSSGCGDDSGWLAEIFIQSVSHFSWPTRTTKTSPADELSALAEQWRRETAHVSSTSDLTGHPAYQRIIGMGRDALPFLLRQLEAHPEHWFPALEAITGIDPVPEADRGRMRRMAEAWTAWGREQGHI